MSREYDSRPRRPSERKPQPDELDARGEKRLNTESADLDLRAGQQKFELGRNPRGAPLSVNEAIARYKEAQARKFSEHITKPPEIRSTDSKKTEAPSGRDSAIPPQPVDNHRQAGADSSALPTRDLSETRRVPSFAEALAASRKEKRPASPAPDSAMPRSRRAEPARLRYDELPVAKNTRPVAKSEVFQGTIVPAGIGEDKISHNDPQVLSEDVLSDTASKLQFSEEETALLIDTDLSADLGQPADSPITDGQIETDGVLSDPAITIPEKDSALSHEKDSLLSHERKGLLQHSRASESPKDAARQKTMPAARYIPLDKATSNDTRQVIQKNDIQPSPRESILEAETFGFAGITAPVGVITETKLQFTNDETGYIVSADPIADSGQPPDAKLHDELPKPEGVISDGVPTEDSPLSHERDTLITHERQSPLQHDFAADASAKTLRHKTIAPDETVYAPKDDKPSDQAISAGITEPVAGTDADWRRVDDSPPPDTIPEAKADTSDAVFPVVAAVTYDEPAVPTDKASETEPTPPEAVSSADAGSDLSADTPIIIEEKHPAPSEVRHDKPAPESGSSPAPEKRAGKKKDSKLHFDDTADTPDRVKSGRKLDKAKRKAGRSAEKLQTARDNIPKRRKLRRNNEFDAEKGKLKSRLRFEKETISQREHMKGRAVTRPVKAGAGAVIAYGHKKIYQVEDENVGVKAAHRGELLAEGGFRSAYRHHKTAPYRKVAKLERKTTKLNAKAAYRQVLHDNPELQKKPLSRMMQKQRIKREYAKAAREATRVGKTAKNTAVTTEKVAAKVVSAVKSHPVVIGVLALILLVIVLMFGLVSSCSNMASGIGASVSAMSYTADDSDINNAELYYTELETDLRLKAANAETDWPGYDEYRYYIDGVGHDPFVLMAYLTAVYQDFTFANIQLILDSVFAEQYQINFTPSVETRYRTETRTGSYTDADGVTQYYTYDVQVPYNWNILTVTLTSQPLINVITPRMNSDQSEQYALLMQSKGLRQYVSSPFAVDWLPYVSSYYGYRVHPITGVKDYHLGIDIALPAGTEILAAQAGTVTFAGNSGDYGLVVVIDDGKGLVTKYAHCNSLSVSAGQTMAAGDVIATLGNTGNSTGPHLHFEVIKDGNYLNPIYFAQSNNS